MLVLPAGSIHWNAASKKCDAALTRPTMAYTACIYGSAVRSDCLCSLRLSVCLLSPTTLTARGIRSWPSSSCRPRTALATHDVQADEGTAAGRAGSSKAQETSCI